MEDIATYVEHLKEENERLKKEKDTILEEYFTLKIQQNINTEFYIDYLEDKDKKAIRNYANMALEKGYETVAIFNKHEDVYDYLFLSHTMDVRRIAKMINEKANGQGGGKEDMVQGRIHCTKEEIEEMMGVIVNGR